MGEHIVRTSPADGVAVLEINRPGARNAFTEQTWVELRDRLHELASDPGVRAVVVTGAGTSFSAGGDIKTMGRVGAGVFAPAHRLLIAQETLRTLHRLPQPTLAAVEGYAIGAGWAVVLACDLVTVARDAFFQAPFLRRAAVPDGGFAALVAARVGRVRTMDLLLDGERLPADDALALGLASRVVDPGHARESGVAQATRIATLPADAVRLTKQLVRGREAWLDDALVAEAAAAALAGHSPDSAEGVRAFLERRPPVFNAGRRGAGQESSNPS
ncbi:Enoyl-CoA hydratase/isomerase [Pseudofrankia inefficax]|uniref:Enoyl-CoA hydratase/isomerase n=2 Tax=Pseudofrankia inefficax (strain DSM 45817 / CECT 9037 / DDB 130130 / EuI1c) TaxID=298654 RepID=E3J934_PSEI1|nr:Enoyl-CoA hydratase/isomerase [Pseudofrankia inefficax]